jgi:lipoprotein-anchoring transpeptidase ErfK/SrfK
VRRTALAALAGVAVAVAGIVVVVVLSRGQGDHAGPTATTPPPVRVVPPPRATPPRPAPPPRPPFGAQLARRTQLRASPGGRVVAALGMRTGYDSERVLSVVGRRGSWLAVLSDHLPNSRAGWIPAASATLLHEPYTLHVSLSKRELVVRHDGRAVRRVTVAIGRPGTTTPTGRFAVTDRLRIAGPRGPYGCCALALTGRQPNLPQGWTTSDRIAIHGTSNEATLGTPASSGCLRAAERDMRWLLARVPDGAPVRIRA